MSCIKQLSKKEKFGLLTSVFSKNYFLWVGSGFSSNFGYGSWKDVLKKTSKKISYPMKLDTKHPLRAAELLCAYYIKNDKNASEYKFNAIVTDALLDSKEKIATPEWIEKFRKFAPNMIVTTNWDNLLEEQFDGLSNVVIRKDKRPQVSNTGRNILKIHGDIGRPKSIVVTQTQYFAFQREDTYLNRKIYTLFSEASPIFLGYSLTDPNIGFLYDEVFADLGDNKPPAYMVVHPSTNKQALEESKLLFQNKNILIIKAEIGDFLNDLNEELKEFEKTTDRFKLEFSNIITKLNQIISQILDKETLSSKKILKLFNKKESRHMGISAFIEILSNQILYQDFGGELLSPENRISYREIDQIINTIIILTSEAGYPIGKHREQFYQSVMELCAKSDGVWDFYTAKKPFSNILRISPDLASTIFEDRIDHIVDILRWSSPSKIGKCWGTWDVYCKHIDWLSEIDIDDIVHQMHIDGRFNYRESDFNWLTKLKKSKCCTKSLAKKIDDIIKENK